MTIEAGATGTAGRPVALADVGGYRVLDAEYTNRLSLPTHTHPRPALSFVARGGFRETTRRGVAVCAAGELHIRPSEEPHANEFDARGTRLTIIDLPLDLALGDRRVRRLVSRAAIVGDGMVRSLAGQLQWELHHRDEASDLAIEGLVVAMVAQLLRATSRASVASDRQPATARLERARDFIDAHFARALRLADVAAVAGFHPASFARAFKRRYEVTPWQYQRRRQLEWVKSELVRSDRPIAAIAHQAGFSDHSHLTRAFHAAEGRPPSAMRRARTA
jgi:AraC family transcriptional regulator